MTFYKKIELIQPFNEVFYKGCFFNSFFPVLPKFGVDELPLLFNDMIVYEMNETSGLISIIFKEFCEVTDVLFELGIRMNMLCREKHIIERLKQSLREEKPVVILIDCYYEPKRKDTFEKLHWPHSLLVFGFDEMKQVFHIVEHNHRESLTYAKQEIGFRELQACYEGYALLASEKESYADYYEFGSVVEDNEHVSVELTTETIAAQFFQHISRNRKWIELSQQALRSFSIKFQTMAADEVAIKSQAEALLENLNQIINGKLVEKHRIGRLFTEEKEQLERIEDIIREWSQIRIVIAKLLFSGMYHESALSSLIQRVQRIVQLEEQLFAFWMQMNQLIRNCTN